MNASRPEIVSLENLYRMLCHAWGRVDTDSLRIAEVSKFDRIEDLFGFLVARATKDILRRGIARGYIDVTEDRRTPKGKLLATETMKRQLRLRGRVACTFDEWSSNIPANRILKGALAWLSGAVSDAGLARDLRTLDRAFVDVSPLPLAPASFQHLAVAPGQRHYGFALDLCALLARWSLPSADGSGRYAFTDPRRDEREMGWLFEAFTRNYLKRHLTSHRVLPTRRLEWGFESESSSAEALIPKMETDIRLDGPDGLTVIEVKFTKDALPAGRDGIRRLRPSHLYQLHTYVTHLSSLQPPLRKAVLLIGTTGGSFTHEYRMRNIDWLVRAIDLRASWDTITTAILTAANGGEVAASVSA